MISICFVNFHSLASFLRVQQNDDCNDKTLGPDSEEVAGVCDSKQLKRSFAQSTRKKSTLKFVE